MAKDNLALEMTADPSEFAEAVDEFSKRRVISREEADQLSDYARKRSWWISGVAQMDVANDAHRSILESMRDGTPFEEWKKAAGAAIEREWGRKDSNRLLLIYRNATTSAYNAGRLEQMEQPHVVAVRPYKMLDVVNDERTSHICRKFISPEVVLPWDDPWWLTHSPPFHHLCRTGIRSLRKLVAQRYGISAEPPVVNIDAGWGMHPKYSEPPKPSERKIQPDPQLHFEAMVKASKDLQERKPVSIPKSAIKKPVEPPPPIKFNELPSEKIPDGVAFPGATHAVNGADDIAARKAFKAASKAHLEEHLTEDERLAIRDYCGSSYKQIRAVSNLSEAEFRERFGKFSGYKAALENRRDIDSALSRMEKLAAAGRPEAKIAEAYRGLDGLTSEQFDSLVNATHVLWSDPTSASWDANVAASYYGKDYSIFYRIKPSKSSKMLSVEGVSSSGYECEVLWGNDVTFRQVGVVRDPDNPKGAIVYLEEVD
jgi:hypothetical protein